jgi:hypothetical protein
MASRQWNNTVNYTAVVASILRRFRLGVPRRGHELIRQDYVVKTARARDTVSLNLSQRQADGIEV